MIDSSICGKENEIVIENFESKSDLASLKLVIDSESTVESTQQLLIKPELIPTMSLNEGKSSPIKSNKDCSSPIV